ncbi:ABC transporter ATP-binding protein/permease [Planctomicrobium piriforme]|uniref:Putative ATP-binding cassette transporter n=1 Tax=Planctomicrobium piriforme TaxID=1576369 RepID=A0A1I3B4J1_9PLAN|nr:SbmA/BacA-like family transporter [Planctomicrobium piriforme]SFH57110.1 putative ATP-binding cassette transporter [Planctomicrobium piriforme]
MIEKDVAHSRQVFRQLLASGSAFFRSRVGTKAKLFTGGLLLLMLCINGMNVVNSYINRYFMSAIQVRDMDGFTFYAWMYAGGFTISTVAAVFYRFTEERLGLLWREWMTHSVTKVYLVQRMYLHTREDDSLSNPDQRITEDVKALTVTTLSFVLMMVNSTLTALFFSGVLWEISPLLFVVAVVYALAGSGMTIWLGRPLVKLNYLQSDFEADFRSDLIRLRENAEGVALSGYEGRLRGRLIHRIERLIKNAHRIILVNRNLGFFTTEYNYMIQLIPILIVAPIFMRQGVDFGIIGQSAIAFSTLVAAFSLIVTQFQSISIYGSVLSRLSEFVEVAEQSTAKNVASCIGCTVATDYFAFHDLTLFAPDETETILIDKLNVTFPPQDRVIITGPAETAKQALFRAVAGLYDAGTGRIERPPENKRVFLPEQPFLPSGTLRDALDPGLHHQHTSDTELLAVLREVGLGNVVDKYDGMTVHRNWHTLLSIQEEHLFAIARTLLIRPDFAVLDRLDTALSIEEEDRVLNLLKKHGITCISFSTRQPRPDVFDDCLELYEDGSWKWTELR